VYGCVCVGGVCVCGMWGVCVCVCGVCGVWCACVRVCVWVVVGGTDVRGRFPLALAALPTANLAWDKQKQGRVRPGHLPMCDVRRATMRMSTGMWALDALGAPSSLPHLEKRGSRRTPAAFQASAGDYVAEDNVEVFILYWVSERCSN
jgi:hypothetical protein